MKVEARYCDACGVKIAPDDLREGEAVQLEESVFYCKPCNEKLAPKKKDGAKADEGDKKPRPSSKRIASSRRLIARRLASGRLARSKGKLPPALTASGEDLRKEPLPPTERAEKTAPDKKKLEDRAKLRAKLGKKPTTASAPASSAPEAPAAEAKAEEIPASAEVVARAEPVAEKAEKSENAAPAADGEKPKKKKKKKDKTKKAKKDKAEKAEASEKSEKAEKVEKAEPVAASAPEAVAEKKDEAKADETKADEKKSDEKKADEKKADDKKADDKKADAEPAAVVATAEKTAAPETEKKAEDKKSDEKKSDEKKSDERPAKKKKKKAEGSEELDELEEISEDAPKAKKKDKDSASAEKKATLTEKAEKAEKPRKKSGDDHKKLASDAKHPAATSSGSKLKTASRTRPGLGKRIGSKAAVDAAKADPGALPKKPRLPMGPMLALGGIVLLLVVAIPLMMPSKKPDQVAQKQDPTELLNDLRQTVANVKDTDEIAARWDGLSEVVEGDARTECTNESVAAKTRLESQAKSKLNDLRDAVDKACGSSDFDGALKAVADFPAQLRATNAWREQGPVLEEKLARRRAAYLEGTALLAEAKRSWEADKSKDTLEGLYAAFPEEARQTDEGKTLADQFAQLISQATHDEIALSSEKAKEGRAKADAENYKKACDRRARIVNESEGDMRKELGDDLFEWQVRPDMMTGASLKDAIKASGGKLTIKNDGGENLYIGKNKRDWSHFIVEFKVKVSKGTKAWFLGKVSGGERKGYTWDGAPGIPISANAVNENDKARPHYFQGIPADTWVTLQYRFIGKTWDVVVDGKEVFLLNVTTANPVGGFGFMCDRGSIEIEAVRTKVLSRRNVNGDDEEE